MASALRPITIRGLQLPNRVAVAPMCTWVADEGTNEVNEIHVVHYTNLALGGSGLVIVEAAAVEYRGRVDTRDLGIWADRFIPGYRRINEYIHSRTQAKVGIQLSHSGRRGNVRNSMTAYARQLGPLDEYGARCIAPSAIAYEGDEDQVFHTPGEATLGDLAMVKEAFVLAAKRAVKCGFDMIEITCAHGFLLCSFLSPISNKRTDKYGGSLRNRCRYPVEVVSAVRQAVPSSMPIFVRISATTQSIGGGLSLDENAYLCQTLIEAGADMIHVSSADRSTNPDDLKHLEFRLASSIHSRAGVKVVVNGDIHNLIDAARILERGEAELVTVGRAMLNNPYWLRNEVGRLELDIWTPPYQMPAYMSARKMETNTRHRCKRIDGSEDEVETSATVNETKAVGRRRPGGGFFICCSGSSTIEADIELVR